MSSVKIQTVLTLAALAPHHSKWAVDWGNMFSGLLVKCRRLIYDDWLVVFSSTEFILSVPDGSRCCFYYHRFLLIRGKAVHLWIPVCLHEHVNCVRSHIRGFLHMWTRSCVSMCSDSRVFWRQTVAGRRGWGGCKGWNFRFLWQYWIAGQECTPRLGWEELWGFGIVIWGMSAGQRGGVQHVYTFANH